MKYKVGDWVIFDQDCRLAFSYIPKGKTGEITDIVDTGLTIAYRIKMKDYPNATVPTDKADEACTKIKSKNDKHNILNGLLNSGGSVDEEKLMEKLESDSEEPEKAINLLREMKHNCEHANKYDDPKRHDKAKALGFAIELIEHGCSAAEPNYGTVKLYTWQDLCDYEILLHERWRIANEQRMEQGQELSVMHTLRQEYMEATKRAMAKLGRDVPADKAKELGFEV